VKLSRTSLGFLILTALTSGLTVDLTADLTAGLTILSAAGFLAAGFTALAGDAFFATGFLTALLAGLTAGLVTVSVFFVTMILSLLTRHSLVAGATGISQRLIT
jgi:hypothetical protein